MRQIVLDTETTGIEVEQGNRVIEIGCVELKNRKPTGNNFWRYVNPERDSEPGALAVHGLTSSFLADKPLFHELADELWAYLEGAELLIHNASFDMGFLEKEFARCGRTVPLASVCTVTDTVTMARRLHPGQKNSLDALCKRYFVDNSNRKFHGALLDAQLLAEVYLAMTGGQSRLMLDAEEKSGQRRENRLLTRLLALPELAGDPAGRTPVVAPTTEEIVRHEARVAAIEKKSGQNFWRTTERQ